MFFNTITTHEWICQVGESVNAKYTDGKFYGAFISTVNVDGTYNVYFQCVTDAEPLNNVPHSHIKKPITTKKSVPHWDNYLGKVFFDEGTNEDGVFFEAGEFIVKKVTANNNYICTRVGDSDGDGEEFDISYVIKRVKIYEEE